VSEPLLTPDAAIGEGILEGGYEAAGFSISPVLRHMPVFALANETGSSELPPLQDDVERCVSSRGLDGIAVDIDIAQSLGRPLAAHPELSRPAPGGRASRPVASSAGDD